MNNKVIASILLLSTSALFAPKKPKPESNPEDFAYGYASKNIKDSVDKLDMMFTGKRAQEVTNGAVIGVFTGLGTVAKMGAELGVEATVTGVTTVAAGTKAAAIAVATSPLTVPIAAGTVAAGSVGFVGYVGWVCHRENQFNRCLSRHFDSTNLNEQGIPRRCGSPERRYAYWYEQGAKSFVRRYQTMKQRGLRPEGEYLGHSKVDDE
jgi:hypothetical protein